MTDASPTELHRRSSAAWLAALGGFILLVALFYPGFMSPDSAEQWLQARTGRYTSAHPPLMAAVWSLTEGVVSGPGGLFVLHSLLFWAGLAWFAHALFARPVSQILTVLFIGLWPPVFGTLPHLWKDVPMVALALLASAALMQNVRRPSWLLLALAIVLLGMACAYRHNALPLSLPFIWYVAGQLAWAQSAARRTIVSGALAIVVATLAALPNQLPQVTQRLTWPVTALWDLSAVSIARGQMLIPASWRLPALTLPELKRAFRPWTNTTIFGTNKIWISLYNDISPTQQDHLRSAWFGLLRDYPMDYLRHRLRVSGLLFGFDQRALPDDWVMAPEMVRLQENPPLALPASPWRDEVVKRLLSLGRTPVYAGWFYGLALLALTVSQRRRVAHPLFWPLVLSAALFAMPLIVAAPGAEFRYLFWPLVAALAAAAVRMSGYTRRANRMCSSRGKLGA